MILGVLLGIIVGILNPSLGESLKPLGDGFIKLIRMLLAPIIFGTIVVGIAKMGSLREVGRVGIKALIYFEVVSTLALVIGLIVVNVLKPGVGMNIDPADARHQIACDLHVRGQISRMLVSFFLDIIPSSIVDAFVKGQHAAGDSFCRVVRSGARATSRPRENDCGRDRFRACTVCSASCG